MMRGFELANFVQFAENGLRVFLLEVHIFLGSLATDDSDALSTYAKQLLPSEILVPVWIWINP